MVATHNTDTDPRHMAPTAGVAVVTSDDECIGKVKEADAGHFKVDVRWHRDFWLSCGLIRSHQNDRLVLSVPRDLLGSYKLHRTNRGFEPMVGGLDARIADQGRSDL